MYILLCVISGLRRHRHAGLRDSLNYIAFDTHKRYTHLRVEDANGNKLDERRLEHYRGELCGYLKRWDAGSPVAVETVGNWYWIVDEIEQAGLKPQLVHARKAKLMMAMGNKSDRLDCVGMNKLQRVGTLPTVWIPPGKLRALRELTRTRMVMVRERTRMKNRIHATLAKYGIRIDGVSDLFGIKGREEFSKALMELNDHARFATEMLIDEVVQLNEKIKAFDKRIKGVLEITEQMSLLQTIPGIGLVLSAVIALEVGEVTRFPRAEKLAAYSGTTPRIYQSGQTLRYGPVRKDVNRYLKYAFMEAANVICLHQNHPRYRHVAKLYARTKARKGHQKAIGAVARHLAEATYWILTKREEYRPPKRSRKTVMHT